ncbi:MAG: hypothetical protein N3E37_01860 [Candidatus Micrarchaeota archaeon]|nr:hypothetical protein [Candidatus Micrarchaeota archaeon]
MRFLYNSNKKFAVRQNSQNPSRATKNNRFKKYFLNTLVVATILSSYNVAYPQYIRVHGSEERNYREVATIYSPEIKQEYVRKKAEQKIKEEVQQKKDNKNFETIKNFFGTVFDYLVLTPITYILSVYHMAMRYLVPFFFYSGIFFIVFGIAIKMIDGLLRKK